MDGLISGVKMCTILMFGTEQAVQIKEVSLRYGCPYFRFVLIEEFHCTYILYILVSSPILPSLLFVFSLLSLPLLSSPSLLPHLPSLALLLFLLLLLLLLLPLPSLLLLCRSCTMRLVALRKALVSRIWCVGSLC